MRLGEGAKLRVKLGRLGVAIYQPGDRITESHLDRIPDSVKKARLISERAYSQQQRKQR